MAFRSAVAVVGAMTLAGCGLGDGLCISSGGRPDECKQGWTAAECAEWDGLQVNGARWSFSVGGTCEDRGFTRRCPDGTWLQSGSSC